jgi:hypothetical protein
MTTENWDTAETSRIIANDEGLYLEAMRIARNAYSTEKLAERMEIEFADIIKSAQYSDVDMSEVDWEEIAAEYMED